MERSPALDQQFQQELTRKLCLISSHYHRRIYVPIQTKTKQNGQCSSSFVRTKKAKKTWHRTEKRSRRRDRRHAVFRNRPRKGKFKYFLSFLFCFLIKIGSNFTFFFDRSLFFLGGNCKCALPKRTRSEYCNADSYRRRCYISQ